MDQLIKLNNKNSIQKNDQNKIKIAFQSGILKYVQRKKKELSGFSTLDGKLKSFEDKIIPTDSNLISKDTDTYFYQSRKMTEPKIYSDINFEFFDRKPRNSFMKKKIKGHKSSLSDWRSLYDQRQNFVTNKQRSDIFEEKMNVTDRLFYPAKKMTTPNFQNEEIKRASCAQIILPQKIDSSNKIKKNKQQLKKQENFVSDQNFCHLFYRSNTPFLFTDKSQNKRIAKYVKENKHRRHQSLYGLGRFNEGFNGQSFIGKKYTRQQKNKSMLEREFNDNFIKTNNFRPKSKILSVGKGKSKQQTIQVFKQRKQDLQKKVVNPQKQLLKNENLNEDKKLKNLSEILCVNLKMQQGKELNLRKFKPRQNKIQKAICNIKPSNSYQNLCKAQTSTKKYSIRQTSTNWTTLYSNFKD